jgi:branched-chain amino acid transport system substrate-binding protein
LAAAPVAQEAEVPMITPSSTNPLVTQVGNYIFRACFVDPYQGEGMAKFAFNELKSKRVAILGDAHSDYSKNLVETFEKTFNKIGGKVVIKQSYVQYDSDYKSQLRAIRKLKPDAIYLPGYYGQVGIIAREARQLKMNVPLLGGDGWDSPELWKLGGKALNNSYITNHFAADNSAIKVQSFIKNYRARFNVDADALAALGYDSVYILADALRRAKTTDGAKLRDAIAQTRDFQGVTGKIRYFDASRNAIKPVTILKLEPQKTKFNYHSTIQP